MATSEELPRTLSRWTEKAFKNILALDKKDLPLVRNKAAAIYLDEDNDLGKQTSGTSHMKPTITDCRSSR